MEVPRYVMWMAVAGLAVMGFYAVTLQSMTDTVKIPRHSVAAKDGRVCTKRFHYAKGLGRGIGPASDGILTWCMHLPPESIAMAWGGVGENWENTLWIARLDWPSKKGFRQLERENDLASRGNPELRATLMREASLRQLSISANSASNPTDRVTPTTSPKPWSAAEQGKLAHAREHCRKVRSYPGVDVYDDPLMTATTSRIANGSGECQAFRDQQLPYELYVVAARDPFAEPMLVYCPIDKVNYCETWFTCGNFYGLLHIGIGYREDLPDVMNDIRIWFLSRQTPPVLRRFVCESPLKRILMPWRLPQYRTANGACAWGVEDIVRSGRRLLFSDVGFWVSAMLPQTEAAD